MTTIARVGLDVEFGAVEQDMSRLDVCASQGQIGGEFFVELSPTSGVAPVAISKVRTRVAGAAASLAGQFVGDTVSASSAHKKSAAAFEMIAFAQAPRIVAAAPRLAPERS